MSSPRLLPLVLVTAPAATLPFLTQSTQFEAPPEELSLNKNSCWGFKIGTWDERNPDPKKIKLLKFGFWKVAGNTCYEPRLTGFESMKDAEQATFQWVNNLCENYSVEPSETWKRRKTRTGKELVRITAEEQKYWMLAKFSECIKMLKGFQEGSEETGLKHSVIGQMISNYR